MATVQLWMDVHCSECVKKLKKAVKDLPGTYYSSCII
jgi:copper chaperone CopZ